MGSEQGNIIRPMPGKSVYLYFDDPVRPGAADLFSALAELGFESVFYIAKNYDGRAAFAGHQCIVTHDGLGQACLLGQKAGIRVYADLMALVEGYEGAFGGGGMSPFFAEHPEVAAVNRAGASIRDVPVGCDRGINFFCCPTSLLVRERLSKIMLEAAAYPIAGVHLDCFRYPIPGDWCYCERCRNAFRERHGGDLLKAPLAQVVQWRCEVMGELTEALNAEFRASAGERSLSALVWRGEYGRELGQQWGAWPLDFVTPLYYIDFYNEPADWVRRAVAADEASPMSIVPAVGGDTGLLSRRVINKMCEMRRFFLTRSVMLGHCDTPELIRILQGESVVERARKDARRLIRVGRAKTVKALRGVIGQSGSGRGCAVE